MYWHIKPKGSNNLLKSKQLLPFGFAGNQAGVHIARYTWPVMAITDGLFGIRPTSITKY